MLYTKEMISMALWRFSLFDNIMQSDSAINVDSEMQVLTSSIDVYVT